MAKNKKDGTKKKSGGTRVRPYFTRVLKINRKKTFGISVETNRIDSPEKVFKIRGAIYNFLDEVYFPNL